MTSVSVSGALDLNGSTKTDIPRKRSKVLRACDACRRKKIRCDATYLSVLLRVTKICNNCTKNGDFCTFSRVPLKRGPSKGYIRDLVERENGLPEVLPAPYPFALAPAPLTLARPRLKLVDAPPKQTLHRIPFAPSALAPALPIILPPLIGPPPSLPLQPERTIYGQTLRPLVHTPDVPDRKFLGPLWKVPYEMPPDGDAALAGSDHSGSFALAVTSRRSSVDSVSSTLTTGLRSHMLSLRLRNSELLVSDLEDDFYAARSRAYSPSSSPRNSVSSLLSLNGRVNKQLSLNLAPAASHPPQPLPLFPPQPTVHRTLAPTPLFPLNSLDHNLSVYYTKFHANLALLPLNESTMQRVAASHTGNLQLHHLFSSALNNLIHYQYVSLENLTSLLHLLLLLYPLEPLPVALNYETLVTLFASLAMVNHTICMSGETYSLGIALTAAIFADYKVIENFHSLVSESSASFDPDDLRLHLARLYLSLLGIDNCHSLSFGTQPCAPDHFDFLYSNIHRLIPSDSMPFVQNMEIARAMHGLVAQKKLINFNTSGSRPKMSFDLASSKAKIPTQSFPMLLINVIKDKFELYNYLSEFNDSIRSLSLTNVDDNADETMDEGQSKITRLVKNLSQSLLSLANYTSTICSRLATSHLMSGDLINPYLNVSHGQSFKLLRSCKTLIDLFAAQSVDNELALKFERVNQDLSIVYNLLLSNLNTNLNAILNMKNAFSQGFRGPGSSPSSYIDQLSLKTLGFTAINYILKKLEVMKLDLSNCPTPVGEAQRVKKSSELLRLELLSSIATILEDENNEGWF